MFGTLEKLEIARINLIASMNTKTLLFGRRSSLGSVALGKILVCEGPQFFCLQKDARVFIDAMNDLNVYATPNGAFSPSADKEARRLT